MKYYVSNEIVEAFNLPSKLMTFDLTNFLGNYLSNVPTGVFNNRKQSNIAVFPNPAFETVTIKVSQQEIGTLYVITDTTGKMVFSDKLNTETTSVNISGLADGPYFIRITGQEGFATFVVKK